MTGRLAALVGQILDVTHLQADPLILERAPVLFAALVARLRGDLAISGRAERLVVELPDDLPPIEVDAAGSARSSRTSSATRSSTRRTSRRSSSAPRSTGSGWWSRSTTKGSASRRRNGRSSPSRSTGPGTSASRASRARVSGCSSAGGSSRRTAGGCGSSDRPDGRAGTRVAFTLPLLWPRRRDRRPIDAGRAGRRVAGRIDDG